MLLERSGAPLVLRERPPTAPGAGEIAIDVEACGVCRTDLHVVDGEIPEARPPVVPGHQVVGRVAALGPGVDRFRIGDRVGVPWLGGACGACHPCRRGDENLCDRPTFTGATRDGGFADRAVANAAFAFALPADRPAIELAPLLCAGLIGWRALRMARTAGVAHRIGLYGFGASAHLVIQVARAQGHELLAFTKAGDLAAQDLARSLGASWAGASTEDSPAPLDAAILFAPDGALVPRALSQVRKGGVVVCAGIHMSDVPSFPYRLLWGERVLRSVANLTRADGDEFFAWCAAHPLRVEAHRYALEDANRALDDLRAGRFTGAAVLVP